MADFAEVILRTPEVVRRTGLSETSLWRLRKANQFPKPIRLGERMIGWPASEIETWLNDRLAERSAA